MGNFCVAIIDDHAAITTALSNILKFKGFDVDSFTNPTVFLESARSKPYDCVLLDEIMDPINGLEVFKICRNEGMQFPTIMVTGNATTELVVTAMEAGFSYVFEKPIIDGKHQELLDRVQMYCDEYRKTIAHDVRRAKQLEVFATLSDREKEVLRQLANGKLNKQMAGEMKVGLRTIETYRSRLMVKIGAETVADAIAFAIAVGLRDDPEEQAQVG
ncbi:MAG: response regulator transcription factor [Aureliella sp.]